MGGIDGRVEGGGGERQKGGDEAGGPSDRIRDVFLFPLRWVCR